MGQVFVKSHLRKGHLVKAYNRKGAGGSASLTGHNNYQWSHGRRPGGHGAWAFEVTTRAGARKTVWRTGMFGEVSKSVLNLQKRMRKGYNTVKILS